MTRTLTIGSLTLDSNLLLAPMAGITNLPVRLVAREQGEPMFNSPQYKAPPKKAERSGGIGFGSMNRSKRPLDQRTLVELPYVDWAYQKSLEPPAEEKPAN